MAGQGRPKTGGRPLKRGAEKRIPGKPVYENTPSLKLPILLVVKQASSATWHHKLEKTQSPSWGCWANSYHLKSQQTSLKVLQQSPMRL